MFGFFRFNSPLMSNQRSFVTVLASFFPFAAELSGLLFIGDGILQVKCQILALNASLRVSNNKRLHL